MTFAARLAAMQELGLEVEILEEEELTRWACARFWAWGRARKAPRRWW
jgi:hypothetical protein